MRAAFYVAVTIVIIAGLGFAWAGRYPEIDQVVPADATAFPAEQLSRGAQLAAMGNCQDCHTTEGGKPFAGGVPIPTPFGTVHSTNITPHADTGIGRWSLAAFSRSLRDGIDREGDHLYPAFPYDHFTKLSDADIEALYAYLMTRDPVEASAPDNELPFPLNIRMVVEGWNVLYLDRGSYTPDSSRSEDWNRGAYLVEAIGHCGSCHTPRNSLGAEIEGRRFAGGHGEGWRGPALNADSPAPVPWTGEAFAAYLGQRWHEHHGMALGPMAEVAANISQGREEDIAAIADYLASFQQDASEEATQSIVANAQEHDWTPIEVAALSSEFGGSAQERGALIFAGACATCHHGGGGVPATRPVSLALSSAVALDEPTNFLRVVDHGIAPEQGRAGPTMPGFGDVLTDDQMADLATYVRSHFTDEPEWAGIADALAHVREHQSGESH